MLQVKRRSSDEVTLVLPSSQARDVVVPHDLKRCTIARHTLGRDRLLLCKLALDQRPRPRVAFMDYVLLSLMFFKVTRILGVYFIIYSCKKL